MSRAKNFGQLAGMMRELSKVPSKVSRKVAPKIRRLVTEQFNAQTSPYGAPWAPYAASSIKRGRRPPLLVETGRLRRGIRVTPSQGAGITITVSAEYAGYHQTGTADMPARPIVPTNVLPAKWRAAIKRALTDAIKEAP